MKKSQHGFGAIEGLLILVIIGLLGFVGWYVWHAKNNTDKNLNTAASTSTSAASTKKTTTANSYAGWQQYCSDFGGLCLKYPMDWKLTTQTFTANQGPSPEVNKITSPDSSLIIYYIPSEGIGGTGNPETMYVVNVANTQSDGLHVISLIDKYNGSPVISNPYTIEGFVSTSLQTSSGGTFTSGATLTSAYEPAIRRFIPANNSKLSTQLSIQDKKDAFTSQKEAQDELNNPDFQTALKILSSTNYSH